jgi:hypothetical protein
VDGSLRRRTVVSRLIGIGRAERGRVAQRVDRLERRGRIGAIAVEHDAVIDGIGGAQCLAGSVAVVDGAEDGRELVIAAGAPAIATLRAGGKGAMLRLLEEMGILRPVAWREIGYRRCVADRRVPLRCAAGDEPGQDDCKAPMSRQDPPPPDRERRRGRRELSAMPMPSAPVRVDNEAVPAPVPRLGKGGARAGDRPVR